MKKALATVIDHEVNMTEFHDMIMKLREHHDSFIETIASWSEDNSVEPEDIVPLISPAILEFIKNEAILRNVIKDDSIHLPF